MCRQNGLEKRRRCGWTDEAPPSAERAVWARGGVTVNSCPKSYVSAQSLAWLEEFRTWKLLGRSGYRGMAAKTVDAFCVLESEWIKQNR